MSYIKRRYRHVDCHKSVSAISQVPQRENIPSVLPENVELVKRHYMNLGCRNV